MKALPVTPRVRRYTALLACLTALALAFAVPSADATFSGTLPANTTTESGWEAYFNGMYGGTNTGSICLGPSLYNGKIYFPWGYGCGAISATWSGGFVTAHLGVINPNSFRIGFTAEST